MDDVAPGAVTLASGGAALKTLSTALRPFLTPDPVLLSITVPPASVKGDGVTPPKDKVRYWLVVTSCTEK